MPDLSALDRIKNFDALPDDALVPPSVAALILDQSTRNIRRGKIVPRRQVSTQRFGVRVGDIRALVRGEKQATA